MAAHIKTFLEQILAEQDLSNDNWQLYQHALSYAKLGDQLDFEDWEFLNNAEHFGDILPQVQLVLLPKYTEKWEKAGCPRTWEDWMENLRAAKSLNSYHFSFGNSTDGPVGYCASIDAETPEAAVLKLRELVAKISEYEFEGWADENDKPFFNYKGEYMIVYFNADAISVKDIDFWHDADGNEYTELEAE